jgi:hypothetical protein
MGEVTMITGGYTEHPQEVTAYQPGKRGAGPRSPDKYGDRRHVQNDKRNNSPKPVKGHFFHVKPYLRILRHHWIESPDVQ